MKYKWGGGGGGGGKVHSMRSSHQGAFKYMPRLGL